MDEEAAGFLSVFFWAAATAAVIILFTTTVWSGVKTDAHAHPQAGWKVHQGTILSTEKPNFGVAPPQTKALVKFTDYYGSPHEVTLHLEQYPAAVGDKTEVDVSKTGSIYAPQSYEYDYNNNPDQEWGGPRSADDTATIFEAAGACVGVLFLSFLLFLVLIGEISFPSVPLRGRLGTK